MEINLGCLKEGDNALIHLSYSVAIVRTALKSHILHILLVLFYLIASPNLHPTVQPSKEQEVNPTLSCPHVPLPLLILPCFIDHH